MNSYRITVRIAANVAINAKSPRIAKEAIETMLKTEAVIQVGLAEFVIEDSEVTGIFDTNWKECNVDD